MQFFSITSVELFLSYITTANYVIIVVLSANGMFV